MDLNKFQERTFLFVAFILGWASLYGVVSGILLILLVVINARKKPREFWQNLRQEKYYLGIPLLFTVYMLLHTLFLKVFGNNDMKASYGIFETMLAYFVPIPLYLLSMKSWMNARLLKKGLLLFCCGVFFLNLCVFFQQTGLGIFVNSSETLQDIYLTRFGTNKLGLFGGLLMLEAQAMVLALASFFAFFLFLKRVRVGIVLMLGLILFLSFTVTKASILAFLLGGIFGGVYLFVRLSRPYKIVVSLSAVVLVVLSLFFIPKGIEQRINETKTEIENIKNGNMAGGSLAPRLAMWKDARKHFSEYALCGVGVYYKPKLQQWYAESPDTILVGMPNVHNSFLQYWIKGGILGLGLIVSYFAFPFVKMWRGRRWSLLVLGGMTIVFVASNTCVLFELANSLPIILFWLSAFYFYLKDFSELEREP